VLGGATLVAQYCRLGAHCFSAGGAGITRDVPPFVIVQGNPAAPRGVNLEGARRRGFTADELSEVKKLYRLLYLAGLSLPEIKVELKEMAEHSRHAAAMLTFVEGARHLLQKE
jgi:UDP-N-acetylglucosamine acyltransferase